MTANTLTLSETLYFQDKCGTGGVLLKIAGIDVTKYIRRAKWEGVFSHESAFLDVDLVRDVLDVVTLSVGQTVELWLGFGAFPAQDSDKLHKGVVETWEPSGGIIRITAYDETHTLANARVDKIYLSTDSQAGKLSAILLDLVTTYGGLSADSTTVQDSGTVNILSRYKVSRTNVWEGVRRLLEKLGWQGYYRASSNKFYAEPIGYTANATTLTTGVEIIEPPYWLEDRKDMCNFVTITGAKFWVDAETELFSGTGSSATYTLTHKPERIKLEEFVGAAWVEKTGGLAGSSSSYDYTFDRDQKTVTYTAANAANNVRVTYSYGLMVPVQVSDSASIGSYGLKIQELAATTELTTADARLWGQKVVSKRKDPFVYTTLKVRNVQAADLAVGQTVTVSDTVNTSIGSRTVLIRRMMWNYPLKYIEIDVGDREWRLADYQTNQAQRIKQLEDEQARDQDLLQKVVQLTHSQEFRRKRRVIKTVGVGTAWIMDHTTNADVDADFLVDDGLGSPVTVEDTTF